jgi:hypothetical protein
MTEQGKSSIDRPAVTQETDVVELRLLLPSYQVSALEAAAVRLELSVAALVRLAISDFLQSPMTIGFVGEVAGRPTAPLPEGIR